jgi:hypothetical protein
MGIVVEYNMNTTVDMDGIRRKVEPRKRVMKHRRLFCKGVPVGLGDVITCFTAMDCSEIEGAMDVCIGVSEIKPVTEGHKLALRGMSLGGIGWPNELCRGGGVGVGMSPSKLYCSQ